MEEQEFWRIISLFDWANSGDDEAVILPVIKELELKEVEEIYSFENILASKLSALDSKVFAKKRFLYFFLIDDTQLSADDFLYSRCVVVANGKEFFESVLENPSLFPRELEFEALLYISMLAYINKTGKQWEYSSPINYETFSNEEGWT